MAIAPRRDRGLRGKTRSVDATSCRPFATSMATDGRSRTDDRRARTTLPGGASRSEPSAVHKNRGRSCLGARNQSPTEKTLGNRSENQRGKHHDQDCSRHVSPFLRPAAGCRLPEREPGQPSTAAASGRFRRLDRRQRDIRSSTEERLLDRLQQRLPAPWAAEC